MAHGGKESAFGTIGIDGLVFLHLQRPHQLPGFGNVLPAANQRWRRVGGQLAQR
ncbi:hypothetical protein D3C80_1320170 [compost metagenome]